MKKATKLIQRTFCFVIIGGMVFALLFLTVPFISVGKAYSSVCADAANLYGFSAEEYEIEFKDKVVNSKGTSVQGLYSGKVDGKYRIQIQKHFLRTVTVETIFHEFAHAAQDKYNMDLGKYNREQHAEILSFSTMWNNGYKWDALHLLPSHLFAKGSEYRAFTELVQIVFA